MDGFQLILIGDTHDLPVLDIKAPKFAAKVTDWSTDVRRSRALAASPFDR